MTSGDTYKDSVPSPRAPSAVHRPHLFVVIECDRTMAGGARYDLANVDEVLIGRGPERMATTELCGRDRRLHLTIPGRSMSRDHAWLRRRGPDWILQDAGSTNGSFLNGEKISSSVLFDGDCIELGHTLLTVRTALKTPAGTPDISDSEAMPRTIRGLTTIIPTLAATYTELAQMSRSPIPVVLTGRTGTGKEVVARAIHALSGRSGPFVAVNCGALAPNLVESALFGHVRGAFSGAIQSELGFIRSADGGTLLLDEIAELPATAQASLLRVLQESEVVPVGSARPVRADFRVIAAAHTSLIDLVARGRMREDLRARLEGYSIALPPLAERREDLGILVADLLLEMGSAGCALMPDAGRLLWSHPWPLNIRELAQALRHALTLAQGNPIDVHHLPDTLTGDLGIGNSTREDITTGEMVRPAPHQPHVESESTLELSDADVQLRNKLILLLQEHRGNIAAVAKSTGKARMQVHRWLRRLHLDAAIYREPTGSYPIRRAT